jgi:hypothetical protein
VRLTLALKLPARSCSFEARIFLSSSAPYFMSVTRVRRRRMWWLVSAVHRLLSAVHSRGGANAVIVLRSLLLLTNNITT